MLDQKVEAALGLGPRRRLLGIAPNPRVSTTHLEDVSVILSEHKDPQLTFNVARDKLVSFREDRREPYRYS